MENLNVLEKKIEFDTRIQKQADLFSMVTTEGMLEKIPSYVLSGIENVSSIFNDVKNNLFVDDKKDMSEFLKELTNLKRNIKRVVSEKEYSSIYKKQVPTIVGLKTDLLTLSNDLNKTLNDIDSKVENYIGTMIVLLSTAINDDDYLKSLQNRLNKFKDIESINKKINDMLTKNLSVNKYEDTAKIEDLIPNLNSLTTIYENIDEYARKYNYKKLKKMNEKIGEVAELSNVLHDKLSRGEYKVSNTTLYELTNALESMGHFVTNLSTLVYLIKQTKEVSERIVEIA